MLLEDHNELAAGRDRHSRNIICHQFRVDVEGRHALDVQCEWSSNLERMCVAQVCLPPTEFYDQLKSLGLIDFTAFKRGAGTPVIAVRSSHAVTQFHRLSREFLAPRHKRPLCKSYIVSCVASWAKAWMQIEGRDCQCHEGQCKIAARLKMQELAKNPCQSISVAGWEWRPGTLSFN